MEHKIKRTVQRLLFSKIEPGLTMRGLAGEEPLVYKELILETIKPSELTLVDLTWSKERKAAGVKLENIQQEIVPIMDCDFCDTFKNSGVTLRTIKEAMDERCNNRYLLYTLCLRGAPLSATWDGLIETSMIIPLLSSLKIKYSQWLLWKKLLDGIKA